jgi:hypothetical protein
VRPSVRVRVRIPSEHDVRAVVAAVGQGRVMSTHTVPRPDLPLHLLMPPEFLKHEDLADVAYFAVYDSQNATETFQVRCIAVEQATVELITLERFTGCYMWPVGVFRAAVALGRQSSAR